MRRAIGRMFGERAQFFGDIGEVRGQRQFRAQRVQFLQIKPQHPRRLQAQRAAHHLRGNERIAVAVAADPAAHAQERRQLLARALVIRRVFGVQPVLQRAVQPRHLVQERVVVERQAVGDLVQHGQLGPAQQVGLPQRQHGAAQLLLAGLEFFRCQVHALAAVEQACDFHLAVDGALAADLGRMRGQNRADQRRSEEPAQLVRADSGLARMRQRAGQRADIAGGILRAHLPDVVVILGDVGEMRKIAVGADDAHGLGGRHAVEDEFQLAPRHAVLVAMEPDRGLPDAFDQVEHVHPLLIAHGIAENAPEQPDFLAQPRIRLKGGDLLGAIAAQVGFGRHDLGRHDWLQKTARHHSVASFSLRRKIKMEAITFVVPAKAGAPHNAWRRLGVRNALRSECPRNEQRTRRMALPAFAGTTSTLKSSAPPSPNTDRAGGA